MIDSYDLGICGMANPCTFVQVSFPNESSLMFLRITKRESLPYFTLQCTYCFVVVNENAFLLLPSK